MKYGHPTLLRQPVWVSLESDADIKFLLRPLSYATVYGMNEYYYIKDNVNFVDSYVPYDILVDSIIDYQGCVGFTDVKEILTQMSVQDKTYLELKLYEISSLTAEQLQNITKLINILIEPTLQSDTFDCNKCKSIPGMQASRNCPLLENHKPLKFKLRIKDTTYTQCPMSELDVYVTNQIIQAYNFLSNNLLPIAGGIGDQSVWFVVVSMRYKYALQELRNSES